MCRALFKKKNWLFVRAVLDKILFMLIVRFCYVFDLILTLSFFNVLCSQFNAMSKHSLVLWLFVYFSDNFDGKSVPSMCSVMLLCCHYHVCMFVYKAD